MAVERDKSRREGILLRMSTRDSVPLMLLSIKHLCPQSIINIVSHTIYSNVCPTSVLFEVLQLHDLKVLGLSSVVALGLFSYFYKGPDKT